jgi:Arc/MetJ-type ribon-helix-helix transcriptional regulator
MVKRKSIKLPEDIIAEIDSRVDKEKGQYRSRPEVVVAALEKFLRGKKRGRRKK